MFFAFRLPVLNNIGKTDYSYGMYLVHYPIILILNYYNLFESNFVVAVIATIGISFMVAYLLEIIQKKIK
jgi:peptidoglycan/LPS O-acetylase OafA/YrhL